jgi:hypothetical protein
MRRKGKRNGKRENRRKKKRKKENEGYYGYFTLLPTLHS